MLRKPNTGGPLNELNGQAGVSAPQNSVPVTHIVKNHRPKSASELEQLIESHINGCGLCGAISKGTVADFGRNLYEVQMTYWKKYKFSLEECIQWEYDLFVLQTFKGRDMEVKIIDALADALGETYSVIDTSRFIDEEFRVDLEIQ